MSSHSLSLLDRCSEALDAARAQGAEHAEVAGEALRRVTATISKHDLQITQSHRETMLGVRVLDRGRLGFACTNNPENVAQICSDALSIATASPADEHNVLPSMIESPAIEGLYDEAAVSFSTEDVVRQAIRMLEVAADVDSRVILGDAEFIATVSERALVNSQGVRREERGSVFTYFALATAREGDVVSNFDFQFDASRSVSGIDVEPITRRASENALGSLGAQPGETFKGPVILAPVAGLFVLTSLIGFQANGMNVFRGMSRWGDQVGKTVASEMVTLVDDGTLPGGVSTSGFDREGVPHRRLTLIEGGTLTGLFHNTYSAHALGTSSTGHAEGSPRTIPSVGGTNLEILPGERTKDDLVSEMKRGLLVTRFSGNTNPITGDFSGVAKGAYLIRDGKIERPVAGTLIAGNAFEALKGISGLSKEQERVFNCTLPFIRLEDVSVTAG
ncbi:MAG: TldD/PmbA family protein [Candidatus Bipolaricaulota bacterium]|nr:MAG: TldD/PmbA family protein [Candidatus Bipolaricaulota bacterium]